MLMLDVVDAIARTPRMPDRFFSLTLYTLFLVAVCLSMSSFPRPKHSYLFRAER